jgi:purine nucleosidase
MSEPRRIILDCDPGHDDAVALLLAAGTPELEIAAVTTVAGNHPVELTTLNACRLCSLAGITAPVARGCSRPLLRQLVTAPEIHGEAGLEGYSWPEPTVRPVAQHAVELIVELVMSSPPGELTLIPTGPLTNIAMAVRREPAIVDRIREVVLMGGSFTRGNMTPAAEFNVYVDPDAAAIVFAAGWPVTMVGLDVTHAASATPPVMERIAAIDNEAGRAVHGLLRFYGERQLAEDGRADPPVHDPVAVARVVRPELVPAVDAHVEVELAGSLTVGMTVVDFKPRPGKPLDAKVATGLDFDGFWDLVVAALARLPAGARS